MIYIYTVIKFFFSLFICYYFFYKKRLYIKNNIVIPIKKVNPELWKQSPYLLAIYGLNFSVAIQALFFKKSEAYKIAKNIIPSKKVILAKWIYILFFLFIFIFMFSSDNSYYEYNNKNFSSPEKDFFFGLYLIFFVLTFMSAGLGLFKSYKLISLILKEKSTKNKPEYTTRTNSPNLYQAWLMEEAIDLFLFNNSFMYEIVQKANLGGKIKQIRYYFFTSFVFLNITYSIFDLTFPR